MLLFWLSWGTAVLVSITGVAALWIGDWRRLPIKYAGVCLSTVASFAMIGLLIMQGESAAACNYAPITCTVFRLYHVARNIAFICFHWAVGRDALLLKGQHHGRE